MYPNNGGHLELILPKLGDESRDRLARIGNHAVNLSLQILDSGLRHRWRGMCDVVETKHWSGKF